MDAVGNWTPNQSTAYREFQADPQTIQKKGKSEVMGTRALTVVQENDQDVMVLYRQFDGYPDGHGQELADFLKGISIGNGISGNKEMGSFANGLGCLAAQIVAHFKTEAGGFYLYPSGSRDCGEEFTYIVTMKDGKPWLAVHEGSVAFFGNPGDIPSDEMPCIWEGYAYDFDASRVKERATRH